jgi:DNA-damage-inducible protein J
MAQSPTTIRLDHDKKDEFAKLCADMGLTVSGAMNLFVTKVLQCRGIPFDISADTDPLYSDYNLSFLRKSIAEIERGEGITVNDVSEVLSNSAR